MSRVSLSLSPPQTHTLSSLSLKLPLKPFSFSPRHTHTHTYEHFQHLTLSHTLTLSLHSFYLTHTHYFHSPSVSHTVFSSLSFVASFSNLFVVHLRSCRGLNKFKENFYYDKKTSKFYLNCEFHFSSQRQTLRFSLHRQKAEVITYKLFCEL